MRRVVLLALLAACSGKKKPQQQAAAPSPPATVAEKPRADYNVKCERFLTPEIMAKHFAGRTLDPGNSQLESWQRSCAIADPKQPVGTLVSVACGDPYVNDESMKQHQEKAKLEGYEPVPDLGRWAAIRGDSLRLWDKDAPCFFMITRYAPKEKLIELGRDLEKAATESDFDKPNVY
jgi:hypothetical protein